MNNIETRTGDISNAYLTAHTTDKIVFNSGPEFAPFGYAGHLLLVKNYLYVLNSYGSRFHSRLSDALTALVFVPSMGGCNIWMRNEGDCFAYMYFYCGDLVFMHKDPDHVFDSFRGKGFTIKETSAPEYFLGGDFGFVKEPKTYNEILTWGHKTYVKRIMDNFNNNFGSDPSKQHAAMPPGYKPEIDTTDLYNDAEKAQYWQCIGEMKWAV